MVYIKCCECGKLIGHLWLDYWSHLNEITNTKMSAEKRSEINKNLFKKYNLRRYCCKKTLMSTINFTDTIGIYG